jgi:protocadherin Fat 4
VTEPDESDTLTYAISEGNTAGLFTIDNMGQLTTALAVPAGTYELTVTVSDGKASDGTNDPAPDAEIMVTITVENTAPVFDETGPITHSISPDTAVGTEVGGPLAVTEPDESDTLTYAISEGNTAGLFTIDNMGQLTTALAVPAGTYELTVTVSDGKASDGTTDPAPDAEIMVTITVENTAPVFDETGPITHSISPDTAVGTEVGGPLAVTEPDESDTLTYAISEGNTAGLFTISDGKASDGTA